MLECKGNSLYNRLGRWRVMKAVWHAIPWQFRLLVFPYCLSVFSKFLAQSTSVDEVKAMHSDLYSNSVMYKLFRPRFHLIKKALVPLDAKPVDQTVSKTTTTARPIAGVPAQRQANAKSNEPV